MLKLAYENNKLMRLPVIHKLAANPPRQGFFEFDQLRLSVVSFSLTISLR